MTKLFSFTLVFALTACSPNLKQPMNKSAYAANPSQKPVRTMTVFTDGLECMNTLIKRSNKQIFLMVNPIANNSGEPSLNSATTILMGALSQMGRGHPGIRIVETDGSTAQQVKLSAKELDYDKADFYIGGSIQSDKNHTQKGEAGRLEAGGMASVDIGDQEKASTLMLDLQMYVYKTQQMDNGIVSSNTVNLIDSSEEAGGGLSYLKYGGVDFNVEYQRNEGRNAGLRSLIELGAIQILGEKFNLPYRDCYRSEESRLAIMKSPAAAVAAAPEPETLPVVPQPKRVPVLAKIVQPLSEVSQTKPEAKVTIESAEKKAAQGDILSQLQLAETYRYKFKDYVQAVAWYKKAAEQGNRKAQMELGYLHYFGEGVAKDYSTAAIWFKQAADQGDAYSQNMIGVMYIKGRGVTQDYAQALMWFKKSADQNYADAQAWVGSMYRDGEGVAKDYSTAAIWYKKAAKQGNEFSIRALKRLGIN